MRTIDAGHTVVTYRSRGDGPTLVLLHGTSVDGHTNFGAVEPAFGQRRRVITPDYGGVGESTLPEGELTHDVLIEQVAHVIRDLGDQPVDLLGDSLGATVAAGMAARYPELVRRLVLVCGWATSADPRHQLVFQTWSKLDAIDPEMGNRYIVSLALSPETLTKLGEADMRALVSQPLPAGTTRRIRLGLKVELEERLAMIAAPTLIVCGRQDYVIPGYQVRRLADGIPQSRLVEIDTGHSAFFERPEDLIVLVNEFLD